jgi:hypothetical protein
MTSLPTFSTVTRLASISAARRTASSILRLISMGATRGFTTIRLVVALTAAATLRVRGDIAERLRLRDPIVLIGPAHRENLRLTVEIVPRPAKFAPPAEASGRSAGLVSPTAKLPPRSISSRAPSGEPASRSCGIRQHARC